MKYLIIILIALRCSTLANRQNGKSDESLTVYENNKFCDIFCRIFFWPHTNFLPSSFRKYIACIFQPYVHYCVCAKIFTYTGRKKKKIIETGWLRKHSSSSPYFLVNFLYARRITELINLMQSPKSRILKWEKLLSQRVIVPGEKTEFEAPTFPS